MSALTISEVARRVGLQPSAIRYYEKIGLLPAAERISGQRRYDITALYWLEIVQRARQLGFTLNEIKELFFGFRDFTHASERWKRLCERKLAEIDARMEEIKTVRSLLQKMMQDCRCETLSQCGKGIYSSARRNAAPRPLSGLAASSQLQ